MDSRISKRAAASSDSITLAITAKAKTSIKDKFKTERKNNIEIGKRILENKFKELNINTNSLIFRKILTEYKIISKDELYNRIGKGQLLLDDLKKVINKKSKNKLMRYWQIQLSKTTSHISLKKLSDNILNIGKSSKQNIITEDLEENYVIAKCCKPIPGDDVIGFNNDGEIVIHKKKCPNALKLMSSFGDKIVTASWTTHRVLSYLARIKLNGIDHVGIVNEITNLISEELAVNMRTIYFDSTDGIFEGYIDLYIHNTYDLNILIHDLKKIKGINSVNRVENIDEEIPVN